MNTQVGTLPLARVAAWRAGARRWWGGLGLRERRMVGLMLVAVAAFLVWSVGVAPALRTLRTAPAQIDAMDQQLQSMRLQAEEARALRAITPVSPAQAGVALKAATDRLGDRAKLSLQPNRAVLTLQGVTGDQLRAWLSEARSGARARPVEAQLTRGPQGYSGSVVVTLGAGS